MARVQLPPRRTFWIAFVMTAFCSPSHRTCDECPWRKDVPVGRFLPERFAALRHTATGPDALKPMFACHKSTEGQDLACIGYLMVGAHSNISVRIAAARGQFDPNRLRSAGELFNNFDEMATANGSPPPAPTVNQDDDLDARHLHPEDLASRVAALNAALTARPVDPSANAGITIQ